MTETFTTIINETTNGMELKNHDSLESIGAEEHSFYNSIRADLDLMAIHPKADTIQKILNHSQNLR